MPALDGVRAVAVSLVLLFHGGLLAGGFLGVDLFFALSGYLITALLLVELDRRGTIALGAFWGRRVRRLVPALVLLVLGTLVLVAVVFSPSDVGANRDEAIASLLEVANWRAIVAPAPNLTILQHTWSLAIEAQFYVVWPLLVLVAARGARPGAASARVLSLALAAATVSTAAMVLLHTDAASVTRVYFGTDTRATPILLGAAAAALAARVAHPSPPTPISASRRPIDDGGASAAGDDRWQRALSAAGLLAAVVFAAVVATVARPDGWLYEGGYLAVSVAAAVLVATLAAGAPAPLAALLSITPLRWLGAISYGVYLWHWPIFYVLDAGRLGLGPWPLLAVRTLVTIAVATASYLLVEQPIRQRRWPRRRQAG